MTKVITQNRRARFDYFIEEVFEAGIVLYGTEVKSLRTSGMANLSATYAAAEKGELYLFGSYIPEYGLSRALGQHEPRRARKLLLRRRERKKLSELIQRDGMTLVPLSLYFSGRGLVKVELGLARGKKRIDKRQSQKERDWKREKSRFLLKKAQ